MNPEPLKPLKILIIGGLGFIGSHLRPALEAFGHQVLVLDKNAHLNDNKYQSAVYGDVRDLDSLIPHFYGHDLIINLAAEHQDNVRPLSLYHEVNVQGAANICAAASQTGSKRILFTSSVAIYGASEAPLSESSPPNYFNEYGRTKYLAEQVYERWLQSSHDHNLTIVRPTVVFGPGNRGNVFNLLHQIKYGPFLMIGDGTNVKSIAHVRNVSRFIAHIATNAPSTHYVVNYADKPDLTIDELVSHAFDSLGRRRTHLTVPRFAGISAGTVADVLSRLLRRSLPISAVRVRKFCSSSRIDATRAFSTGFRPELDLREGLSEMLRLHV